jgi:hypothetical protein
MLFWLPRQTFQNATAHTDKENGNFPQPNRFLAGFKSHINIQFPEYRNHNPEETVFAAIDS